MGQSTNAILFYGYCWSEEDTQLFGEDEDDTWEEVLAVRRGATNPWTFYRESGAEAQHNTLPYGPQQDAAYNAWKEEVGFEEMYETWAATTKAIKSEYNVEVSSHCSCDYPMPYIYTHETEARRGFPQSIDIAELNQSPINYWNDELARFVKELDIDISEAEGPGWFLVSNWC